MKHPFDESPTSPLPNNHDSEEDNWVDSQEPTPTIPQPPSPPLPQRLPRSRKTLILVETAFLASTGSLIWLINYYFPLGPILRVFFPVPVALAYLRWGSRAAWMTAVVSGLLLSVLMGPTRSIVFLIPFGLMGVQLGACWRRGASWWFSIVTGMLIGVFGFFFRVWLFSLLLGEDLWLYAITQVTGLLDWIFINLGLLVQPTFWLVQLLAVVTIFFNNLLYLFAIHLVSLLVLDRLGNPIPRPPKWLQVILDYD